MTSFVLAMMLTLVGVERAAAHDTFVLPEKFRVAKGETVVIGFHSSDAFPESTQLIKRLQDPTVHLPGGPLRLQAETILQRNGEAGERIALFLVVVGIEEVFVGPPI